MPRTTNEHIISDYNVKKAIAAEFGTNYSVVVANYDILCEFCYLYGTNNRLNSILILIKFSIK